MGGVEAQLNDAATRDGQRESTPEVYEVVKLSPYWRSRTLRIIKRALDVVVAASLLVVLSPLFLVLAIGVKLSSKGPVFYRWKVVGTRGRRFVGYKFRSMCANADELKSNLAGKNEMEGPVFKLTDDPRVTPFGSWMRRYSLDELPQLYSVFVADMSLVGPRPPLVTEYEQFTDYQKQKLAVKPGITCLWQVGGRNDVKDFNEWVRLDLEYIRSWSPWLDLSILVKTMGAVVSGTGK
jgi:lipopolysaccharide/colanic/teichoic acid biosynthesis glycosyltransferase